MKIVDTNIFSKVLSGESALGFSGDVYTTEDLRNEIDILKSQFPNHRTKFQKIKFNEIENHQYFDQVQYISNYKRLINKYTNITSFYGLKGFGDMSILASVSVILNPANPNLFDTVERIEIVTHDADLKKALTEEFADQIDISDPLDDE